MSEQEQQDEPRTYPIEEDLALQRRLWRFERVGWYGLCLIVLLALLGLFSKGPLSHKEVRNAEGTLLIQYQRFVRNGATSQLLLQARGAPAKPLELVLAGDLLEGFSIETIQPAPQLSASAGQGVRLEVQPDSHGTARVHLSLRNAGVGLYREEVGLAGSEPVRFTQFIYP